MPTLDLSNPLLDEVIDVWDASSPTLTLHLGYAAHRAGANATTGNVVLGSDANGAFICGDGSTTFAGWELGDSNNFVDDNTGTLSVVRMCNDETDRGYLHVGYDSDANSRVILALPEAGAGGFAKADYGNANTGQGRLVVAYAKEEDAIEVWSLVYDSSSRGRELYLNGVLLGSDTGARQVRPSDSAKFCIGAPFNNTVIDNVNYYAVVSTARDWTPVEIASFAANWRQIYVTSGAFTASCAETAAATDAGTAIRAAFASSAESAAATDSASASMPGAFTAASAETAAASDASTARYGQVTTPPLKNNTGTLLANLTGITIDVYRISTGALVVRKTGVTTDANGVAVITDQAISAGSTDYKYDPDLSSTNLGNLGRRTPTAVAT